MALYGGEPAREAAGRQGVSLWPPWPCLPVLSSTNTAQGRHACPTRTRPETAAGGGGAEQRWGVDAGRTRILAWSSTAPTDFYTSSRFARWRC